MLDLALLDMLAAGFTVLARFHQDPPDEVSLARFWELLDEWPLTGTPGAEEGLRRMREARTAGEDPAAIRSDHAWLYGTLATARVAPYESVHRGQEGLVFDEHTLQVRQAYRTLSLRAPQPNREPDDHIGLELDFIAQSCVRALEAQDQGSTSDAERYVRLGADFFRDHLGVWAPQMLTRVALEARTGFMSGLAHLSLGALESYARFAALTAPSERE
ncbi:molecular chaperone TorD family protein [Georgenia yuyongxinii]|uniref:Molecular chaperone TorD family protein n=1 Tax=Georgenia yuyongxinii TaxID=2589797 RepID=A0A5B8C8E4_9MICO|nr:molecular chaperone TorD family protein [Georgenia yuyongxinii]QDC26327.1 molecular chaperone TorD family protein [Georgenia yuyongxinii]